MAKVIYSDEEVTIYRAEKYDINGNPRHIVHFMDFLTEEENKGDILQRYEYTAQKIKRCGGGWRRYNCREFGGGFITQGDYNNGKTTAKYVKEIKNSKI